MTVDQEQELLILYIFISNGKDKYSSKELIDIMHPQLGDAMWTVVHELQNKGLIIYHPHRRNNETDSYEISVPGKLRYKALKKEGRKKVIKAIVGWLTFAAAIVSAVYGMLTYHGCGESKSQQELKLNKEQEQPIITPPQTKKPDTTVVRQMDRPSIN